MKIFQTSGSYHIVEYKNKRYVLDNTTIEPKKYYWGQPIDELSVKMYEISKTDTRFNIKKTVTVSEAGISYFLYFYY